MVVVANVSFLGHVDIQAKGLHQWGCLSGFRHDLPEPGLGAVVPPGVRAGPSNQNHPGQPESGVIAGVGDATPLPIGRQAVGLAQDVRGVVQKFGNQRVPFRSLGSRMWGHLRQVQRFLSIHDPIANLFHLRRDHRPASDYRAARAQAFIAWAEVAGAPLAA